MPATSLPLVPVARDELLKIRVTPGEKRRLAGLAAAQGRSLSELVRLSLPLTGPPVPDATGLTVAGIVTRFSDE